MIKYKILIFLLLLSSPVLAGTIDDFEGGVDWGAAPWSAEWPLWNYDTGETTVTETMNAEWTNTFGDQTAGPDFGFRSHDMTIGANGTSASLRYTVTGGNDKSSTSGKVVYGQGPVGSIYLSGQPSATQTFTVDGTTFTMQTASRSGAGEVQIGATTLETAQNMAAAINADISTLNVHAVATASGGIGDAVTISQAGTIFPVMSEATVVTTALSSSIYWQSPSPQGTKKIYSSFPSLISDVETTAGGFYLTFGSTGGSDSLGNNTRIVVPEAIKPPGSNQMSFYVLSPNSGALTYDPLEQGMSFGTYINNQERYDAGCSTNQFHMYHNAILMKSNYWAKYIMDANPDHVVGVTTPYTPYNPTTVNYIPTCNGTDYPMNYWESVTWFYVDQSTKHITANPWDTWFDEFKIYEDTRVQAFEYVASRSATYIGEGEMVIGWTGRWGTVAQGAPEDYTTIADAYKIYYAKNVILTGSNFIPAGTLAGSYTRASGSKLAWAVFTIPNFDENATYSFAISPDNEPTTAGFIEYKSGAAYSGTPPANKQKYKFGTNLINSVTNE